MKRSDELKRQASDLLDDSERMTKAAEREGRDFTAVETTTFNANMDKVKALHEEIEAAEKQEHNTALVRAAKASLNTPMPEFNRNGTGPYVPGGDVRVKDPTVKAFANASDAYDSFLWLKGRIGGDSQCMQKFEARHGMTWLGTQNETSPTDGGYLVPPSFANAVMVSRQETGALRKLARIVPMKSDSLAYPKQTAGTTVYYPGEEGSITASDMDFGRVNLVPKKRAIYSLVSNELRDDAAVSIMDLLAQDMGHQLALKEDAEGIVGDGTSTYGGELGIRPAVIAASASVFTPTADEDAWDELTYLTFAGVMATLPAKYRVAKNLKWLCSPAFKWAVMDRLAIASNGAVSQVFVDGIMQDRFLGHEVVLSDDMPSTTAVSQVCAIFGNFDRAVLLGERTEVRIASSEHIAFQTDQTAVRATVRYDIAVHEAGDASTAGAIVGLSTHS
jgi:HK97 family phage major capsid protein